MPRGRSLQVCALGVAGTLVIGVIDHRLGDDLTFPMLYLLPVGAAAWWGGIVSGGVTALAAGAVWFGANREWAAALFGPGAFAGASAFRLLFFLGAAVLFTRLRQALNLARTAARTDRLTGVCNRVALEEFAAREIEVARRHSIPLSALFIDVDDLKRLNDEHGHSAGDVVLRWIGRLLADTIRAGDCAARFGGDEFIVLLPRTAAGQVREVARRILDGVRAFTSEQGVPATVSIGVVTFERPPESFGELLRVADRAMYAAKQHGKDSIISLDMGFAAGTPPVLKRAATKAQ